MKEIDSRPMALLDSIAAPSDLRGLSAEQLDEASPPRSAT